MSEESECAVNNILDTKIEKNQGICVNINIIKALKDFMVSEKLEEPNIIKILSPEELVLNLMSKLGVVNERDIWKNEKIIKKFGRGVSYNILKKNYKVDGPSNTTNLLNNHNIDNVLETYVLKGPELYHNRFLHLPFQMIDFWENKTELARIDFMNLSKYDSVGVVLNSDFSYGPGKHWFAIYIDLSEMRRQKKLVIEYFNSSGRMPYEQIIEYYENLKEDYARKYPDIDVELKVVVNERIQESKTECGMFSLIFIIGRIEGKSVQFFSKKNVTDEDMIRYRKIIFVK